MEIFIVPLHHRFFMKHLVIYVKIKKISLFIQSNLFSIFTAFFCVCVCVSEITVFNKFAGLNLKWDLIRLPKVRHVDGSWS